MKMKTSTIKKLAAVSAAIICLASCGKVDEITPKEGKATLTTTTTTAAETTVEEETTTEAEEITEEDVSKEDEKPDEKKDDKKKVTTAKKAETTTTAKKTAATTTTAKKPAATTTTTKKPAATTTTKPTTTTTTTTTTPAPEPEPQPGHTCTNFVDGVRIVYNGIEFGIGDGADGVVGSLGEQIAPSEEVPSCMDGHTATIYHFSGMDISAYNGTIYEVHFDTAVNVNGSDVRLKAGPGLGSSADDINNAFGSDFGFSGGGDFFQYDSDGYHLQMNLDGSGIYFILLQCPALG